MHTAVQRYFVLENKIEIYEQWLSLFFSRHSLLKNASERHTGRQHSTGESLRAENTEGTTADKEDESSALEKPVSHKRNPQVDGEES